MENYKLTKTIRFKLEAKNGYIPDIETGIEELKNHSGFQLIEFVSDLKSFINDLERYIFYQKEDKSFSIKDNLNIKREWLRQYAKQELAAFNKEKKKEKSDKKTRELLTIKSFNKLADKIKNRLEELKNIYGNLAGDAAKNLDKRARKARTGLILQQLKVKLFFLAALVENLNDKNETDNLSVKLKNKGQKLQKNLLLGIKEFLPAQSSGLPIAKASFNYYTLNKKSIDFTQRIKELEQSLKVDNLESLNNYYDKKEKESKNYIDKEIFDKIVKDINNKLENKTLLFGEPPIIDDKSYVSLRQILKNIKSKQKKQFNEKITQGLTYEGLKESDLYLFSNISEADFNEYKTKTDEITRKAADINNADNKQLRGELKTLKEERGSLINGADRKNKDNFKTYKEFANFYRSIAQKHGKILSKLKGIEKEKIESQTLKYWAVIFEENKNHKLILIPKEKAADCKKFIENNNKNETKPIKIFWFESFTYRSLQKLCFGHLNLDNEEKDQNKKINSFYPEIIKELSQNIYSAKDYELKIKDEKITKTEIAAKFLKGEYELTDQGKISFYKDVLRSNYTKSVLKIPIHLIQEEVINKTFSTLDDFKIALEKVCYQRFATCDENILQELQEKYTAQIFDITSLDLKNLENSKNKEQKFIHTNKNHTKIWKNFWSNKNEKQNFEIRLNPEITITYRQPKESRVKKYGKGSKLYDPNKNNRYLYPQFTLISTISEYCNSPTKNLSFLSDDEFEKSVNDFNNNLRKENFKFAFGIDNGETELSTLGVYLPDFNTNNDEKIAKLKEIKKYGFEVLTIKDLSYEEKDIKGKERKIIENPSYFLKKENYMQTFGKSEDDYNKMFEHQFEKKHSLTLDLTTAKLICGHIVTNGDVMSFFNLSLRNAQRKVYEINDAESHKIKDYEIKKTTTDKNKTYVNININFVDNGFKSVFQIRPVFEKILSCDEMLSKIKEYGQRKISNEELDLKINHLRTAIVANVIGIIDFLYQQYKLRFDGEGLVVKEGFDTSKVSSDLEKFSGNIYRILERKLYQKFQNYGLVPPIKDLLSLREEKPETNKVLLLLGNIAFVNEAGTSQECPVCIEEGELRHTTNCSNNCGFDSKNIMHSNDGIAGFNIAKRGLENLTNAKNQN